MKPAAEIAEAADVLSESEIGGVTKKYKRGESMAIDIILETKDGDQFKFPVLPERLEIAGATGNQSIETIKQGEVTVFGQRKLRQFCIESILTANESAPYCRTKGAEYKPPIDCVKQLITMQESGEPVRFITTGLDLNAFWVSVEDVSWRYESGTLDIGVKVNFKEYRPFGQRIKKYEITQDVFGLTNEEKTLEGAGAWREPTGWAIGDNVIASGFYYTSPAGASAGGAVLIDRPENFLTNAWTAAQTSIYKAAKTRQKYLKNVRAVIIDIVKKQSFAGLEVKSAAAYCIADKDTKKRLGWVDASQMIRA